MAPKYLKDLIPNDYCKVAFHKMSPFQKGVSNKGHRDVGFSSNDPDIVKRDFDIIQSFGRGIDASRLGVAPNWYGPSHTNEQYIEDSCAKYLHECEQRGMFISHNCDQGIGGGTLGMIAAFAYLSKNYFPSKAYLKDENGKLLLSEFTANTVDWRAVSSAFPAVRVLHWSNNGPDNYAWLKPSNYVDGVTNPLPLDRLKTDNLHTYMNAVGLSFDDAYTKDITLSTWQESDGTRKPRRWINPQMGDFWLQSWKSVRADCKIVWVVTFDDYDEDSCLAKALGVKTDRPFAMPAGLSDVFPNIVAELAAPPDLTPVPMPVPVPVLPPSPVPVVFPGATLKQLSPIVRISGAPYFINFTTASPGVTRMEVWFNGDKKSFTNGNTIKDTVNIPPPDPNASGPDANQIVVQAVGTVNGNVDTVLARFLQKI